jgi:hypothetical protein
MRAVCWLFSAAGTIGEVGMGAATGMATNTSRVLPESATTERWRRSMCSRTQRLSWLALMPHWRARRETDAPGLPHAATNSAFAASSYTPRVHRSCGPPEVGAPSLPYRLTSRSHVHLRGSVGCQAAAPRSRTRFIDRLRFKVLAKGAPAGQRAVLRGRAARTRMPRVPEGGGYLAGECSFNRMPPAHLRLPPEFARCLAAPAFSRALLSGDARMALPRPWPSPIWDSALIQIRSDHHLSLEIS